MVNNRQKGKRVERWVVAWLKQRGVTEARRSQQYCGMDGAADIFTGSLLSDWHIEVKGTARSRLTTAQVENWIEQVRRDGPDKKQVVLNKPNGKELMALVIKGLPHEEEPVNIVVAPGTEPESLLDQWKDYYWQCPSASVRIMRAEEWLKRAL